MATGSGGAAPVSEDTVHGAVIALRGLAEAIRKSDMLADGDVLIDIIEQTSGGVSHLRQSAGSVQLNVEDFQIRSQTKW